MVVVVAIAVEVPFVLCAHHASILLEAGVELQRFKAELVLDAVVGQGEWRWWHLAWTPPIEGVRGPVVHVVVLVQGDVYAQVAGVVVRLDVEGLGHRLRRGVEFELAPGVVASLHVNAVTELVGHAVVGADHQVLD